jgi:DNA-binding MarR family transcriptional regulator
MGNTRPTFESHSMPLILHLARTGRRAADASTGPDDLRHRQVLALTLLSSRGATSQQALSEILDLDPSNVVGLLNGLEERGLITRRRDQADRRRHIVELSPEGRTALEQTQARLAAVEDEIFHALSAEERATLHELLLRAADGHPVECDHGPSCERTGP